MKILYVVLEGLGGTIEKDEGEVFSEAVCLKGSLGELQGMELMPLLVKYAKG